jgi:hypothetical protein
MDKLQIIMVSDAPASDVSSRETQKVLQDVLRNDDQLKEARDIESSLTSSLPVLQQEHSELVATRNELVAARNHEMVTEARQKSQEADRKLWQFKRWRLSLMSS